MSFEHRAEVALIRKSASQGDFREGGAGIHKKFTGVLDAALADKLADGRLIILSELARQVNRMNAGDRCQISQARRLQVSIIQSFAYSPQPGWSVGRTAFTDGA